MAPPRRSYRTNPDLKTNDSQNHVNERAATRTRSSPNPPSPPPPPATASHTRAPPAQPQRKDSARSSSPDLNILSVVFGDRLVTPWFPSLYREELIGLEPINKLYVCPRCFRYSGVGEHYVGHVGRCAAEVPGRVVYAKEPYQIYEIDGEEDTLQLFTQNLSLFAKLFIENKSVCFDVNTFLYYLLVLDTTESDSAPTTPNSLKRKKLPSTKSSANSIFRPQKQIVGFFSKEKLSWDNNNLACIVVFPPWQKTGLGQLLMGASYEISKREGRLGGPERPLSTLGRASYLTYWARSVASALITRPTNRHLTIRELSDLTFMLPEDVVVAMMHMGVLGNDTSDKGNDENTANGQKKRKKKKIDVIAPKKKKDGSVKVEKSKLRAWAAKKNIDIESPVVDVEGFVGGSWGQIEIDEEDEDEDEDREVEGEEEDDEGEEEE